MKKTKVISRIFKIIIVITITFFVGVLILFYYKTPVTKNTDSYVYDLPFESGNKSRVVQGYGGLFSHKNIAAIDFEMPVGTAIYAAREGIVYAYRDNFDEGGASSHFKNKANYIISNMQMAVLVVTGT